MRAQHHQTLPPRNRSHAGHRQRALRVRATNLKPRVRKNALLEKNRTSVQLVYLMNNPLSGTDPTGYKLECPDGDTGDCSFDGKDITGIEIHADGAVVAHVNGEKYEVKKADISNGSGTTAIDFTTAQTKTSIAANIGALRDKGFYKASQYTGVDRVEALKSRSAGEMFGGFSKMVAAGGVVAFLCGDPVRGSACLAYGLGEAAAGDEEQAKTFMLAGTGAGIANKFPAVPSRVPRPSANSWANAPPAPWNPARAELPVNTGGKTEGVLHVEGMEPIPLISGIRGPSEAVRGQGLPGFNGNQLTHVEGHAAAYMRTNNVREAVLDINKAPCGAGSGGGCNGLLPRMLPPNARLTVRYPEGETIYEGLPD